MMVIPYAYVKITYGVGPRLCFADNSGLGEIKLL